VVAVAIGPQTREWNAKGTGMELAHALVVALLLAPLAASRAQEARGGLHTVETNQRLLVLDEGLLLGNGDLSASVYQTADRVIWRLGKSDVWDRR
jgi:hypothetical protein